MATTTNYGWTTPDDTALVKDGAAAIRSLGTAIDTSMNTALGTKKAGLVLLNTTSFSAVSSQSINSVFSSTYTNYSIVLFVLPSAFSALQFRLRASGTDATGANYNFQQIRAYSGTTLNTSAVASQTSWQFGASFNDDTTADYKIIKAEIIRPNEAVNTKYFFQHYQGADRSELNFVGGTHAVASAYDGFSIYPSTGNITGTVSVYGYNK